MAGSVTDERTAALLWQAARPWPDAAAVTAAVDAGADLGAAAGLSHGHGVGPLLWRSLGLASRRDGLGAAGARLRTEAAVRRMEALLLLPRAVAASAGALAGAGFEPLVFKGPALAARYPEPGLRSMVDIDLVLPRAQHAAALAVLVGGGWEVTRPLRRGEYDTGLTHPDVPGLFLELHRGLDRWWERSASLRVEDLYGRRVPIDCLGTPAWGLPPEVELLALVVHAGKPFHCFNRLIWMVDLVVVAEAAAASGAPLDWESVAGLAGAWDCRTLLAVALTQARRLGLDCPDGLTAVRGSATRLAALRPPLAAGWLLAPGDASTRHQLRYALVDGYRHRVMLFVGSPVRATPLPLWPVRYAAVVLRAFRRFWRLRHTASRPDDGVAWRR